MSLSITPSMPWDLERFFWGNSLLTKTERSVAVQILRSWDREFWPVDARLASQTLIAHWVGCWRSTACRALRKMVALGYFRTTWRTVKRDTRQGWKGVTRVSVSPGPELLKLINPARPGVSAAQVRGVTWSHTPRTPPGPPGTVGSSVIANSADRSGGAAVTNSELKRKTLAEWPRLAGERPRSADRLPSAIPFAELDLQRRDGGELGELSNEEYAARLALARQQRDARERAELAAREARQQPRRRPPRSQR